MRLEPPIEILVDEAKKLSLLVRVAHIERRSGLAQASVQAWNGEQLHSDQLRPAKEAERKKFIKALTSRSDVEVQKIDDALLELNETLVTRLHKAEDEGEQAEGSAASPTIEILDQAPPALRRPLCLVEGRSYAAVWPHIKITTNEGYDGEGRVIKYDDPLVRTERRLWILRDDGLSFGDGCDQEIGDLDLDLYLKEVPPNDKLWSPAGMKRFQAGARPDACEVFNKIADVVDRFIDFDHSLADQRTMAEMVACYILATWYLDAFNVIGFMWPNGERGSGKTQLLTIVSELAYLGQIILAGGSYASLRDMADYGATLCFDDAENLSDPRKTDPDKRALLLAGNRRGNTVPIKEPAPDGTWQTRYVNTFCPRLFSAIRLPDAVLASRTIIVPLIRTPDRFRANADPAEYAIWPHDRKRLIDDLWALALVHLKELSPFESYVNKEARLTGRNLEPWKALLAVARWLENRGHVGLWDRMEDLSVKYQEERQDFESSDFTTIAIRALCDLAGCDPCDPCDPSFEDITPDFYKTSEINERLKSLIEREEVEIKLEYVTPSRTGKLLAKLRFQRHRAGGTGAKGWRISRKELQKWVKVYGLDRVPSQQGSQGSQGSQFNHTEEPSLFNSSTYSKADVTLEEKRCDPSESEQGSHMTDVTDECDPSSDSHGSHSELDEFYPEGY